MEVHAHSHTERKKWTHYFWEFLMLFLAVFSGFLAEYQLEHIIENQREKKFAHLLYEDLKKDSAFLQSILEVKKWRENKMDSFIYYTSLPDLQQYANQIYYYSVFAGMNLPFKPADATFQQLRNSGSLRYFKNYQLYNTIINYYKACSFYGDREEETVSPLPHALTSRIFDSEIFLRMLHVTPDIKEAVSYPREPLQLLSTDKILVNELKSYFVTAKTNNKLTTMLLNISVKIELDKLIYSLKKEYRLE